ncbi:hypothetical protein TWF569_003110 [Orbilia oligospora]|nr:hypothetical protein TWF569_003110 [Orbilia oligospora]
MYWVQPGGQKLGDQVFGSFVGFSNDHTYIKSSRSKAAFHSRFDGALWIALITTIFGFVTQFVGLREIHSSVIMAIIRAGLRSQRMTKETDLVKKDSQERYRHILPGHELDFLATKLEDIGTLFVSPKQDLQEGVPPALGISPSQTSSVTSSRTLGNGVRALKARARLARLTSDEEYGVSWKDLRVREVAIQLQSAIEGVMETMSVKLRDPNVRNHQWRLEILSTPEASIETIPETFSLQLRKEGVAWRIDCSELEAILGIWEWSLFRYKAGRAIGGDMRKTQTIRLIAAAPSARLGEAKTWYQVWIQRRLTLEQEGAYSIDRNKPIWTIPIGDLPLFGCQVARDVTDTNQPIYVYTKNSPLTMCAQDVFISFLGGVLREIDEIGGKTETRTPVDSQDVFLLRNNQIDAMVDHFENSGLGSREDAYMCIILMLVRESKLPGSEDVLTAVQDQVAFKKMTANGRTLNNYSDELNGEKDKDGQNALSWAAQNGNFDMTATLLEKDADKNISDDNDRTPLSYAAENGHHSIVEILSKGGSDSINLGAKHTGETALMLAAQNGHETIVELLLKVPYIRMGVRGRGGDTAFLRAIRGTHQRTALLLIDKGADVNAVNKKYETALQMAVRNGNPNLVELLLGKGADVNMKADRGWTALKEAKKQGHLEIVQILISSGADTEEAVEDAVETGQREMVKLLIENNADFNENYGAALGHAVEMQYRDIVELLLQNNVDINANDRDALQMAASRGYREIIELLIQYNVDIKGDDGRTLQFAARSGHREIVELLIQNGADVNGNHVGVLHCAIERGHHEIVKLLTELKNAQASVQNSDGETEPMLS